MDRYILTLTLLFASSKMTLRAQELFHLGTLQPAVAKSPSGESINQLAMVNSRPYVRPMKKDQFGNYLKDSYGVPRMARSFVRSFYEPFRDKRDGWGQDWHDNGQRFGSNGAITANNDSPRYVMGKQFRLSCKVSF